VRFPIWRLRLRGRILMEASALGSRDITIILVVVKIAVQR